MHNGKPSLPMTMKTNPEPPMMTQKLPGAMCAHTFCKMQRRPSALVVTAVVEEVDADTDDEAGDGSDTEEEEDVLLTASS